MSKTDSTKVMWRVMVRKARGLRWERRGLYETREAARHMAAYMRDVHTLDFTVFSGYGFGNTKVVRFVRGEKK